MGASPKILSVVSNQLPHLRLLNMQEVAERLGVSLQRAYEMGRSGLLPVVRLGRQMRVEEGRLIAWVEGGGRALPGGWRRRPD
jgi:excisionase family DNA binding protein